MKSRDQILKDYKDKVIDKDEAKKQLAELQRCLLGAPLQRDTVKYDEDIYVVDTCFACDILQYETAIWNDGIRSKIVVTERCETKEEAKKMHDKWVDMINKMLKEENEPLKLWDVLKKEFISLGEKDV